MFWLVLFTLFATSAAAYFIFQQWITLDQTMQIGNRADVYSTHFRFIHYGYKPNGTDVQWIVAPLIENAGNTGTHRMMIKTETVIGPVDFGVLDQREFTPALLPPKADMTAGVIAIEGPKLSEYKTGQLTGIGIIGTLTFSVTLISRSFVTALNSSASIGMDGPLGSRCAFPASHAMTIIATTSIAVHIGASGQRAKNETLL